MKLPRYESCRVWIKKKRKFNHITVEVAIHSKWSPGRRGACKLMSASLPPIFSKHPQLGGALWMFSPNAHCVTPFPVSCFSKAERVTPQVYF